MTPIRFFVLTPTHNRAERVVRAIESVQRQTHADWEMFVYDDGSSDDTAERLKPFAVDDRIHVWSSAVNRGANHARNALLERILEREEPGFIAILDDDDLYVEDALERVAAELERTGARWLIARCRTAEGLALTRLSCEGDIDYVHDHKFGSSMSGEVAHFFHTDLVAEARFTNRYRNAEEWYFYYELARRAKMWAFDFEAVVMEYLETGLSLSQPNTDHKAELYALKLERLGDHASPRLKARLLAKIARQQLGSGDRREGYRSLIRAFRHWPFELRVYQFLVQGWLPRGLGGL